VLAKDKGRFVKNKKSHVNRLVLDGT